MNFEPTHEFRGLKLKLLDRRGPGSLFRYQDEKGVLYYLEEKVVTKLHPRPKPGEVWKFLDAYDPYPLVIIDEDGRGFRSGECDYLPFFNNERGQMMKVLNADGTPA